MSFDPRVLQKVLKDCETERERREETYEARRETAYMRSPRLREIDTSMRLLAIDAARAALAGGDADSAIRAIHGRANAFEQERKRILEGMGKPADYLTEQYACPACADTGYVGNKPCRCLMERYRREQAAELTTFIGADNVGFDHFRLDYYPAEFDKERGISARENAENIRDDCKEFADTFEVGKRGDSGKRRNLYLNGAPGLGKTFLAACIAQVVVGKGCSVVYESAVTMFMRFDQERFGRGGADAASDIKRYMTCDLLVIDDLGCEISGAGVAPALYMVINTRLGDGLRTIITSNIRADQLASRYSGQIASRVNGLYTQLYLFGTDIRAI